MCPQRRGPLSLTRPLLLLRAQAGSDPKLGPDSDYPEWLWALAAPRPALSELRRRHDAGGGGADGLPLEEGLRLVRMTRRAAIKAANATGGKE